MNVMAQVVLGDFRDRVRRPSFLGTITAATLLGFAVMSETFGLRVGDFRGEYNAAWIGLLTATTLAFFLSFFGFYLVRGLLQRDQESGVGQILAAAPLRNYLLSAPSPVVLR